MVLSHGPVLFVAMLVAPPPGPSAPASALRAFAKKSEGRFAYGIYLKNKKVGWMIEDRKMAKYAGQDVLTSVEQDYMSFTVDGEKTVNSETKTTHCELTGAGAILFVESRKTEDGVTTIFRAKRDGKNMKVTVLVGKKKTERTVLLPRDTLQNDRRFEAWLAGRRKPGDRFTQFSFDWDETNLESRDIYIFKSRTTLTWGGVKTPVIMVDTLQNGAKVESQVLGDGRPLTAKIGKLMDMRLEKEATVKNLDAPIDMIAATAVPIDRKLGRPGNVERLVLEARGLGDFVVPSSHRQIIKPGKDTTFLEIRHDSRVAKAEGLTKEKRASFLETSPRLQSDHKTVRDLAKKIVGAETDQLKKARLIERWVYKNLEKSYRDNADTALGVLERKAGDCTEHTLLFVALARAAGLPAREVGGVAYENAPKPKFAWHAWAEVHDGHQWVSVDPTWDQVYVDGTHIKMSEGDKDMAWVNVVGGLTFKLVKLEKKKK
jgi:hypothetical protein